MPRPAGGRPVAVDAFDFEPGSVLAGKYAVVARLGGGYEGEVYLVSELRTGIERAAKVFFPQRNPRDRTLRYNATKLHRLRKCPIVIPYHTQESMCFRGTEVTFLVSEFVDGERLSELLERQPGKRLTPFAAMHLLHALAAGLEQVHREGEYHGDLHGDNVIVQHFGLTFDLKLIDLFHWQAPKKENIREDMLQMIRIFYDALGGQRHYHRQPPEVKAICRGLKRGLILERFRSAGDVRLHLERMAWG